MCLDPQWSVSFDRSSWRDDVVAGWLDARGFALRRGRFVGGWLDPLDDCVWLDVVRVVPRVAAPGAVALARHRGQHYVYDLRRGRVVPIAKAA